MTCHSTGRLAHLTQSEGAPQVCTAAPHAGTAPRTQPLLGARGRGARWPAQLLQSSGCHRDAGTAGDQVLPSLCCRAPRGPGKSPSWEGTDKLCSPHPLHSPLPGPPSHPSGLCLILFLAKEPCPAPRRPRSQHHSKGLGCPAPRRCPSWAEAGCRPCAGREQSRVRSQRVLRGGCFPSHPTNTDVFSVQDPDRGG